MTENESSGLDRTTADPIDEWAQRGLTAPAERASTSPAGPGSDEAADSEEAEYSERGNRAVRDALHGGDTAGGIANGIGSA